jgi:hypothetical protein
MTDFAVFLGEKVERYIELRRALGYAFDKQAGTLRAFVRGHTAHFPAGYKIDWKVMRR